MESVQYCGGIPLVLWRDTISTVEGYHKYCGEIPLVLWKDTIITVEGYFTALRRMFSTNGERSVLWRDTTSTVEGYH